VVNRSRSLFVSICFRAPSFGWRIVAPVALLATLLGAAACSKTADTTTAAGGGRGRGGRGAGGAAQPVVVARVTQKDVPVDIAAVGNVEAFNLITVRSQVTGELQQVYVHEGDSVKKGALLAQIDPRPLQAAVEQAQANLTRDVALVRQAEAQLARDASNAEYQQLTAERQGKLVAAGIISKDTAEQARANADATAATVNADKANVESAQAQLVVQQSATDNAKVQLNYAAIRAPIDGRLGDVTVKTGNLVTANNSALMTIAQIEPVLVTFSVPAVHLPTIKLHTSGPEKLSVTAIPQDADAQPATGLLTFWDNVVDSTTDTIKLKATFKNEEHRLWPGQFARVSLRLTTIMGATVVPQQAVQTGQEGQFVFVVNQGGGGRGGRRGGDATAAPAAAPAAGGDAPAAATVEQRPITAGQRVGDDIVVEKGLRPGETVVTEGQLRLEAGTRVSVSDANGNVVGGRGRGAAGRGRNAGAAAGGQGAAGAQTPARGGQAGDQGRAQ
jgi:multidrug efflux system membrane fusion protein